VGLLTTRGFRDTLEIGRIRTPDLYNLRWDKPVPLVPRRQRLEVDERIAADGSIVRPLVPTSVIAAADRLVAEGVEVIALCFLNSYANPAHEEEAVRILRDRFPSLLTTASCHVLPEIREYERTSTTVVNAYLLPIMRRYLANLVEGLRGDGIAAPLLTVASNGGVVSARSAGERPVIAVGSGPAAGVSGAARAGNVAGVSHAIAFDMGGTTAKASLIEDGRPTLTSEYEFREGISTSSRFIKAGGYMLKAPAIDIAEVGAGAGSIAWIDGGGLLRVGPESAGAVPGPACYGLGGERPTVTDANVVLGFLNPEFLAGGELPIDASRAHQAIERHVAAPLGLSVVDAAHGVRAVANANMARAIRAVTIERGRDPRDFELIAFGGSGPGHAVDLARTLEIRRVLVPISPGVFTAVGMLASDVEHHFVRAHGASLATLEIEGARGALDRMLAEARGVLRDEGYPETAVRLDVGVDLRYFGQASELTVALPSPRFTAEGLSRLAGAFRQEYEKTYGYSTDEDLELVNLRVVATGLREERLDFGALRRPDRPSRAANAIRNVAFEPGQGYQRTPVFARESVPGAPVPGPAIIESYDSTVVVPPGSEAYADERGNLRIRT
jgi:N-methylhydantoinase A